MLSESTSALSVRTSGDLDTNTSTFATSQDALDFDAMSADEIRAATLEVQGQNETVEREIELFEHYANKVNLQDILAPANVDFIEKLSSRRKKRHEPKKEKLKIHQKIEIVSKLLDETNKAINIAEQEHEVKVDLLTCKLEQFDEQNKDIQKHKIEFEREFGRDDKKKGNGDRYVRFCTDRIAASEGQIGKLKLKRQSMKDQLRKVNLSLKQKEETGDTLLAVDFQQLRIENAQYLERIDTKNKELINAKLKGGKAQVSLQKKRRELQEATMKQQLVKDRILQVTLDAELIEGDNLSTRDDVKLVQSDLNEKCDHMDSYTVPDIFEYIKQAGEYSQLSHDIGEWQRKVHIAEGANNSLRLQWKRTHRS